MSGSNTPLADALRAADIEFLEERDFEARKEGVWDAVIEANSTISANALRWKEDTLIEDFKQNIPNNVKEYVRGVLSSCPARTSVYVFYLVGAEETYCEYGIFITLYLVTSDDEEEYCIYPTGPSGGLD